MLAAEGYPPAPTRKGDVIEGLDAAGGHEDVIVFQAGTGTDDAGRIVTNGGRVLTVTATGAERGRRARPCVRGRGGDFVARRPLPSRHRRPGPHVIPRYSLPEIAELFTDEARFGAWLEVEVLAVEAWAKLGVVPAADARIVRERAGFDVAAIHEREKVTDHDVAAFVDVVQERVGHAGRRRGCTTASRRATWSTPRSRSR